MGSSAVTQIVFERLKVQHIGLVKKTLILCWAPGLTEMMKVYGHSGLLRIRRQVDRDRGIKEYSDNEAWAAQARSKSHEEVQRQAVASQARWVGAQRNVRPKLRPSFLAFFETWLWLSCFPSLLVCLFAKGAPFLKHVVSPPAGHAFCGTFFCFWADSFSVMACPIHLRQMIGFQNHPKLNNIDFGSVYMKPLMRRDLCGLLATMNTFRFITPQNMDDYNYNLEEDQRTPRGV